MANSVLASNAEKKWKNYEEFSAGIDTNRLPNTHDYAGREMQIAFDDGSRLDLRFDAEMVAWTWNGRSGTDTYEEVKNTPKNYFFDLYMKESNSALTIVINSETRRVIAIHAWVRGADEPAMEGETSKMSQKFYVGVILGGEPSGEVPHESRELIGYRAINIYSPHHTYEHFYVNSKRYAWQCLNGEQQGQGDMDYSTCYKLEDDMYIFAFREKIIPVCSVFFFDYKYQGRCTGKFLGINGDGTISNRRAGAFIQKMSYNCYPFGVQPI